MRALRRTPFPLLALALLTPLAWGCSEAPAMERTVTLDASSRDATDAPSGAAVDATLTDVPRDLGAETSAGPEPVELGTGLDRFEELPRDGGSVELVHGPQGGWHVLGRVRLRGVAPDVYLRFALLPVGGGSAVTVDDSVRRQEPRGLARVDDAWQSTAGELVILSEGLRPGDVVGRRFRFTVRVERLDASMARVLVGADERGVTVIDDVK